LPHLDNNTNSNTDIATDKNPMVAVRILKLLFCFKKPEFINLSYINVLVKDKPLLFIVWEIKNAWSVKLIPLQRRHYETKKVLILSIPKEQNDITIKAVNFWRKTKMGLTMYAVELDEASTAQLIQGFRPLNKVEVSAPHVSGIRIVLLKK
jgi:hypothetical protein